MISKSYLCSALMILFQDLVDEMRHHHLHRQLFVFLLVICLKIISLSKELMVFSISDNLPN